MKKSILLLCLILFCMSVGKGLYFLKDGFNFRRIHCLDKQVAEDWEEEADLALAQTYSYIGRGRQCFAFASADDRYVLKLPRTDIYKTPFWVRALPVKSYRERLAANHLKLEQFIRSSFEISFGQLQNQTGLIAVHFGQSTSKGKTLTLMDKLGCKHRLSLEKTCFVLQYKRPILMQAFSRALENGDKKEAKRILDAWVDVVEERARKGILNRDRSFLRNYGFDGERAYQIDVGSFFCDPELKIADAYQKSIRDSVDPVQEWLVQKDLEMLAYLDQKLWLLFRMNCD